MSEEGDTPLLDAVADFAKHLFRIPIPPHGRIAVVSDEPLQIYTCICKAADSVGTNHLLTYLLTYLVLVICYKYKERLFL